MTELEGVNLEHLTPEEFKAVRRALAAVRRREDRQRALQWTSNGSYMVNPEKCLVCGAKTFIGLRCFDHMFRGHTAAQMGADWRQQRAILDEAILKEIREAKR